MRILTAVILTAACALPSFAADLRFEPDLEIGDEEPLVQYFSDVLVMDGGGFIVVDSGLGKFHEFDGRGEWIATFGQLGDGPGDLPHRARTALDGDRIVVAGQGARVDLMALDGTWLAGFQRVHPTQPVRSLAAGPAGRFALVVPHLGDETIIDVYDAHHAFVRSIGTIYCAGRDYERRYVASYVGGTVAFDRDSRLVFLQSAPFELRRYALDGKLLASTRTGGGDIVGEPPAPIIDGDRMTVLMKGAATGVVVLAGGAVVSSAFKRDEDATTSVIALHDEEFDLIARAILPGFHRVLAADAENRVFMATRTDEAQYLTRNVVLVGEPND